MTAAGPGDGAAWAQLRETHSAVVFLVGDRAYKMKKPVDLGFLDFTALEVRREVCRREVALNRRLAPDVYLGTATLVGPDAGPGEPLVVMRRMPDARRLSTLVLRGALSDDDLRRIAKLVAAFHAGAVRGPEVSREGGADPLGRRWSASFDQVRPFHGTVLDGDSCAEAEHLALRYVAGRDRLFADRVQAGLVVDGHGDLLADDIFCLPDGPRVLDCLEFDDRLRYVDPLDDGAFLAMDLEFLGAGELARSYLRYYREYSGDAAPSSLVEHYLAYRAFVRAKVSCFRHAQGDENAGPAARRLLALTVEHLRRGRVRLLLVGGLPGTGKSTLAGHLADRLGLVLLSSDRTRKELAGLAPQAAAPAAYGRDLYGWDRTEATYQALISRARVALRHGESVVIDASWTHASHRRSAQQLATQTRADLSGLLCTAPTAVADRRLAHRSGPSDADPAVAAAMAARADPWPDACVVNTTGTEEATLREALAHLTGPRQRG